jgi:hypothetical protein
VALFTLKVIISREIVVLLKITVGMKSGYSTKLLSLVSSDQDDRDCMKPVDFVSRKNSLHSYF